MNSLKISVFLIKRIRISPWLRELTFGALLTLRICQLSKISKIWLVFQCHKKHVIKEKQLLFLVILEMFQRSDIKRNIIQISLRKALANLISRISRRKLATQFSLRNKIEIKLHLPKKWNNLISATFLKAVGVFAMGPICRESASVWLSIKIPIERQEFLSWLSHNRFLKNVSVAMPNHILYRLLFLINEFC